MTKMPVVILISGTGSNMRVIAEQACAGDLPIEVRAVLSDRATAAGLHTAAQLGIAHQTLDPQAFATRSEFDSALAERINDHQPQLVILAGFMRILGPTFIQRFTGQMLNIHPSLLPRYRGLHTHRRALAAGDTEHGASVHFVTEELDGGPIIIQARVPILPQDTEQTLATRVLQQEHLIFPRAINWFATGRLYYRDHKAWLDNQELTLPVLFNAN